MGHHVGGHVGEPASLCIGVGAEPDEGFVDADAELDAQDAGGLVDLRPVSAQVLETAICQCSVDRCASLLDPRVEQEQRREIGERQRVGQFPGIQHRRHVGVQVQDPPG